MTSETGDLVDNLLTDAEVLDDDDTDSDDDADSDSSTSSDENTVAADIVIDDDGPRIDVDKVKEINDSYQWGSGSDSDDDRPVNIRTKAKNTAPVKERCVQISEIYTRVIHKDIRDYLRKHFRKPQRNLWEETPECWVYTKRNPRYNSVSNSTIKLPQVSRTDGKGVRKDYPVYGYLF